MIDNSNTDMPSANKIVNIIFDTQLSKSKEYDQEIVSIVKKHLGSGTIQNKAGNNLASELKVLAKKRI